MHRKLTDVGIHLLSGLVTSFHSLAPIILHLWTDNGWLEVMTYEVTYGSYYLMHWAEEGSQVGMAVHLGILPQESRCRPGGCWESCLHLATGRQTAFTVKVPRCSVSINWISCHLSVRVLVFSRTFFLIHLLLELLAFNYCIFFHEIK